MQMLKLDDTFTSASVGALILAAADVNDKS